MLCFCLFCTILTLLAFVIALIILIDQYSNWHPILLSDTYWCFNCGCDKVEVVILSILLSSMNLLNNSTHFCSMVVKGIVCKKNVAHRRMTSKIEKPRFLILGGALEYQRVTNLLSSFDTLLQQVFQLL